jgi:hypothetical protein
MDPLARAQSNPDSSPSTHQRPRRQSFKRSQSVPEDELRHVIAAHFIDDYGAHHYNPDAHGEDEDEDDLRCPTSPTTDDDEKTEVLSTKTAQNTQPSEQNVDLERGRSRLTREKTSRSRRSYSNRDDAFLVSWKDADDPENPKNWTFKQKWAATAIVSVFTFISPTSSSMSAPALPLIGRDLGVTNNTELALLISVFVLAYAVGPLFLGPLSEIYGRRIVLQLSNLFFLVRIHPRIDMKR